MNTGVIEVNPTLALLPRKALPAGKERAINQGSVRDTGWKGAWDTGKHNWGSRECFVMGMGSCKMTDVH